MQLHTNIIAYYRKHQPIPKEWHWVYQYTKGVHPIAHNRQEVCLALCEELTRYTKSFPIWNRTVISTLFTDNLASLHTMQILPIIGAHPSIDCKIVQHDQTPYILIDLLNIADYTPILSQMHYILHNQMHIHLTRYLIHQHWQPSFHSYKDTLHTYFFIEGLAQYVSWNEDLSTYPFQQEHYQQKKNRSYALLQRAQQVEDQQMQQVLIEKLSQADIWENFPLVAGMFFFHDVYQSQKEKGLYAAFAHGPISCMNHLLK